MRKLLLAVLVAAIQTIGSPSIASAQGYIEGSVGFVLFPDIETNDYSFITPLGEFFEGNFESSIDSSWAFGAEAGFQTGPFRFGASWDFIDAETDTARLEGTLDGVPFSFEASDEDLEYFGIDANHDVNIFAANAYYVFNSGSFLGALNMSVQPYVGLGLGAATFENMDSTFAFLVTLGANVPLGPSAYLGGRYRLALISGPSRDDDFNDTIDLDGFTTHIFSLVLGFRFGV